MIFVTVGTHEQQFNRLIEYMDNWAANHDEEVIIQTGYSTYEPRVAKWQKLFSYQEMKKNIEEARIVITHGGPSSFIAPLQIGKIPIVVPRRKEFDEHVNDHQVNFCKMVDERKKNIILVEDEKILEKVIVEYNQIVKNKYQDLKSNNDFFCLQIEKIVQELFMEN